jgi:D-alanyl-lipoteichoic acid acyltransferase DltB (MBOAT superfamily)
MTPETTMHLINYSVIVLIVTIIYCIGLIIFRTYNIAKSISCREHEFMNSVYFKLKIEEREKINAKIHNNLELEKPLINGKL